MLPELPENEADGEIATIYGEIREFCRVPYVSSLQRHLATRDGWLEWVWALVRPALADGHGQAAAWREAVVTDIEPLPKLSPAVLSVLGVDEAATRTIRDICDSFIRVSPTNLMQSGLLRRVLMGERPGGEAPPSAIPPLPAPVPVPPPMVAMGALDADARAVLESFGTVVAGQPFVPGLYRMLARWPAYLAHTSAVLVPRFTEARTSAACDRLLARIDGAVPEVFARLPGLPDRAMPPESEFADVLDATERYRETSPQMVVFSTLIRDALPD